MATENYSSSSAGEKRRRPINDSEPPPPIAKLRDDLLVEILIRLLNPKSAWRCKPVCQRWRSLISTPYFTRRFISTCTAAAIEDGRGVDDGILDHLIGSHSPVPKPFLSFLPRLPDGVRHRIRVFDCFKDLVLCGFADRVGSYSYLICNPFTKQWIALPLAPPKPLVAGLVPRLVCQPPRGNNANNSSNVDDSFGGFYKFRVVCIYEWRARWGDSVVVDVFCSESGKWTEAARVLSRGLGLERGPKNVVSWDGELFWMCPMHGPPVSLVGFNPFRLDEDDVPLASIEHPAVSMGSPATQLWDFSVSRGGLHVIRLEADTGYGGVRDALTVWRLEEDRRSWRKLYEALVLRKNTYALPNGYAALKLHPEKPEIVFIECRYGTGKASTCNVFYCDLRTGELELYGEVRQEKSRWTVFKPRVDWFPTPIPRYKELRGKYDGSFSCLVQTTS